MQLSNPLKFTKTRTILLIDDREDRRQQMEEHLRRLGFQTRGYPSLHQAYSACAGQPLDILFVPQRLITEQELVHFHRLRSEHLQVYSILLSEPQQLPHTLALINKGFDVYLPGDASIEMIEATLLQASAILNLREEVQELQTRHQEARIFYQNLLDASDEAIVVVNQNYEIQYCNLRFQHFMGAKASSLIGQTLHSFIDDGYRVLHYVYHQLTLGKKIRGYRVTLKPLKSNNFDVNISANFLYSPGGYVEGIILLMENYTFQNELFVQLMRQERLKLIQYLANALAHEVHNPVNILSGHFQLLQQELQEKEHTRSLEIIQRQIERISHTVSQMQQFNQSKEGSVPQVLAPVEFLKKFLQQHRDRFRKQYTLHYQQGEAEVQVHGNQAQFEDAFLYLFRLIEATTNSEDATPIRCHLLKSFTAESCLEIQFHLGESELTADTFNLSQDFRPNNRYSVLDVALIYTIFSNYEGKIFVETSSRGQGVLKLQFPVVGVKSLATGETTDTRSSSRPRKRKKDNPSGKSRP